MTAPARTSCRLTCAFLLSLPQSFDLVYCLGVVHHLEQPQVGVRALAKLVRPGGELRLYVYKTLDDEPAWKQLIFTGVTALRRLTTRLPYTLVHAVALARGGHGDAAIHSGRGSS